MIRRCPVHGFFRGETCNCGEKGNLVLDAPRVEKLGRFISGALRHFPEDLGLAMDQRGWVDLEVLYDAMKTRYKWANKKHLQALVESDVKGRYEIRKGKIRARYGHSVHVDLEYPPCNLEKVYYGASREEVDIILEGGLRPVRQRYVHLSTTPEKSLEVASFHTENPVIIEIDAKKAQEDGIKMLEVNQNIILSEEVPPPYLTLYKPKTDQI